MKSADNRSESTAITDLAGIDGQKNERLGAFWRIIRLFQRLLVEPFHDIQDPVRCKQSQLLAGLLLVVVFLQAMSLDLVPQTDGTIPLYFKIAIALNVMAYLLSRTPFYQAGALLWAICTSATIFISIADGSQMGIPEVGFFFLVFSMLLPALVVGPAIIASIGVFNVAGVALFATGVVNVSAVIDFSQALIFNIAATFIITGMILYLNYLEKIRQQHLFGSEMNLRALAESAKDGFLVDQDGKHVFTNKSMAIMLGYEDPDELIGTSMVDVVHPDEFERVQARYQSGSSGEEQPAQYETLFKTKSGTPIPVELNASMTQWQGRPAGMVSVRDISERKQAEREPRTQAKIIDQIHDSVISTDLEGLVTSWNKGAERLFGYTSSEMLGKHIATVYPQEEHAYLQNEVILSDILNKTA